MTNMFPLYLPDYVLYALVTLTSSFCVTTILLGVIFIGCPIWHAPARIASYCILGLLSALIATEQVMWALAVLIFYLVWPNPKDSNAR
jgi:hypothetical protein